MLKLSGVSQLLQPTKLFKFSKKIIQIEKVLLKKESVDGKMEMHRIHIASS